MLRSAGGQWRQSRIRKALLIPRRYTATLPFIKIDDATFYKSYPSTANSATNPPIFPHLSFTLPANSDSSTEQQHWSIVSNSSLARTTFLQILAGSLISSPPNARSYPFLSASARYPGSAISYIGFDAERTGTAATRGAYLSARYESRKEETDFKLLDYLTGNTELNPLERNKGVDERLMTRCIDDLRLSNLLTMPVGNLSNGQTRRARIARALMSRPQLLLLDGPFMGLDPPSVTLLSGVLKQLAEACRPRLVLSLRKGDLIPDWTTHLVAVEDTSAIQAQGPKEKVLASLGSTSAAPGPASQKGDEATPRHARLSTDGFPATFPPRTLGEPVVEISGARVTYSDAPRPILGGWSGGLHLTLQAGHRTAILGPNGSGKTTLLSLITSDHPQAYSQPVRILGRSRLPGPGEKGISVFDLQRMIGHSSPEVHAFFPRHLSVRRALESAWADAPLARPEVGEAERRRVDRLLAWFEPELRSATGAATPGPRADARLSPAEELHRREADLTWAVEARFGDLPFSSQRLVLFLRATVARQRLVVLDEAFSGMDRAVREKAFLFLAHGDQKLRLAIGEAGQEPGLPMAGPGDIVESGVGGVVPGLGGEQALLVVAHDKGDVPGCVREWMCLPEPAGEGEEQAPPRWGELEGPLELHPRAWGEIWGAAGGA